MCPQRRPQGQGILEKFTSDDEVEKLSGQLLLDVANCLPGVLKHKYLNSLEHKDLNLNRPGFESLRKFVLQ